MVITPFVRGGERQLQRGLLHTHIFRVLEFEVCLFSFTLKIEVVHLSVEDVPSFLFKVMFAISTCICGFVFKSSHVCSFSGFRVLRF